MVPKRKMPCGSCRAILGNPERGVDLERKQIALEFRPHDHDFFWLAVRRGKSLAHADQQTAAQEKDRRSSRDNQTAAESGTVHDRPPGGDRRVFTITWP